MLGIGLLIAFVISTPWITFPALAVAYLGTIPVSILAHRRLAARRAMAEPVDHPTPQPH